MSTSMDIEALDAILECPSPTRRPESSWTSVYAVADADTEAGEKVLRIVAQGGQDASETLAPEIMY